MLDRLQSVTLILSTLLVFSSWLTPAVGKADLISQAQGTIPPAPPTGTPSGNPRPGTTRPEASCKETSKSLVALFLKTGDNLIHAEYPSLWFYIPYEPDDIRLIEFLLLDGKERRTIYRTQVDLAETAGVIKIAIPDDPQYALKVNETYRWYLKLDCEPDETIEPDLVVDGWLRRLPLESLPPDPLEAMTFQNYLFYRDNDLWYDAINTLAELHFANPENRQFSSAWAELLESFGAGEVASEQRVGAELRSNEQDD